MQLVESDIKLQERLEQAEITALFYYPIKSCAGIAVSEAEVIETGFLHDRELMLIEAHSGSFLTQRELPALALVHPYIENDLLRLNAPGMPELEIPLIKESQSIPSIVWRDNCESIDQGNEVADWFKHYLKVDCRLVRLAPDFPRRIDPNYATSQNDQVSFADAFPFLLLSEESLADLNQRLAVTLPMSRFRPNIVMAGSGIAYAEDYVKYIGFGEVTFAVVKPCARCKITTTDQLTSEVGKEPLRTLATYRKIPNGGVIFGQNLIQQGRGRLKVGDKAKVQELKPGPALVE